MRANKAATSISLVLVTSLSLSLVSSMGPVAAAAAAPSTLSVGQTIYAAAYSYVLMGQGGQKFPVTSTLIIRNIDPESPISVTSVDYRDSKGEHVRHYLEKPITIGPLASKEFHVSESDVTGGHSPNFIVQWKASKAVNSPVVESLMIGGRGGRGISFIGRAWVIEEAGSSR